ncbi:MAG TPA: HEAT repeat domain-containing protein [Methanosarcinales archaeon]|nr:HEAT repeat domain-containing protein [Methanosarcinales archaeon]
MVAEVVELIELLKLGTRTRKTRCDAATTLGDMCRDVNSDLSMVFDALTKVIWRDDSRAVRNAAAISLCKLGDNGFNMLLKMSIDDSIKIRLMAESLSKLGDMYYPVFNEIKEQDRLVRKSIVEAFGNFKEEAVVTALIELLESEAAISRHKPREEWDSWYNLHWAYVSEHLGKVADANIDALLDVLKSGCRVTRVCVADALGEVGEKRFETRYTENLREIRTVHRENVDRRVVPALMEALCDPYYLVSRNAARSLGRIGDRSAVAALIMFLEPIGEDAARALGNIGDTTAIPALIEVLPLRGAAYALGKIGDMYAIPALKGALVQEIEASIEASEGGGCYYLNWEPARALCEFESEGLDAIIDAVKPYIANLERFDDLVSIVKGDYTAINSSDKYNEDSLALELCDLYDELQNEYAIVPLLIYLMKCASENVGVVAAQMMYLLENQALHRFFDLLRDDDVGVRRVVARLGSVEPAYLSELFNPYFELDLYIDEIDVLLNALKDSDPGVRQSIAEMFSKIIVKGSFDINYAIDNLIYLIDDPEPYVRETAAEALYRFGSNVCEGLTDQERMNIVGTLLDASEDESIRCAIDCVDNYLWGGIDIANQSNLFYSGGKTDKGKE